MAITKSLKSNLHALVWKEGAWFVAKCKEIEVASQGKTQKESLSNLHEAIELYLENEKVPIQTPLANPSLHNLQIGYA